MPLFRSTGCSYQIVINKQQQGSDWPMFSNLSTFVKTPQNPWEWHNNRARFFIRTCHLQTTYQWTRSPVCNLESKSKCFNWSFPKRNCFSKYKFGKSYLGCITVNTHTLSRGKGASLSCTAESIICICKGWSCSTEFANHRPKKRRNM